MLERFKRVLHIASFASRLGFKYTRAGPVEAGKWAVLGLSDLGPAFIKLGQMLSARPIAPFSPLFTSQLLPLQDRVHSQTRVRSSSTPETPANVVLLPGPFRSASLAEVYKGDRDGEQEVVLKIIRPGTELSLSIDLWLLQQLPFGVRWKALIRELDEQLHHEMDLAREQLCLQLAQRAFDGYDWAVAPEALDLYAGEGGLLQSYEEGDTYAEVGVNPLLARRVAASYALFILRTGCFHSDPHPGNVAFRGDKVIWYDLGALQPMPAGMHKMLPALLGGPEAVHDALVQNGMLVRTPGSREIFRTVWDSSFGYSDIDLSTLELSTRSLELRHDIILLGRSLFTLQGLCQSLDPSFRLDDVSQLSKDVSIFDVIGFAMTTGDL